MSAVEPQIPTDQQSQHKLIISLRQQVHKSFLQINEMQRLFAMQIEHARQQLQQRQKALSDQQALLSSQRQDLADKLKQCHYMESFSLDETELQEIPFADQSLRDSGIYTKLQEMIGECELKSSDPETVLGYLGEMHSAVKQALGKPLAQLAKLFSVATEYCLENFRLREEARNSTEMAEVYNKKIQELSSALTALKNSNDDLKINNQLLIVDKSRLESLLKSRQADLLQKKKQLQGAWQQNSRLLDTLRSQTSSENSQDQTCKSILGEKHINHEPNVNHSYTLKVSKARPNHSSFEKGRLSLQPQSTLFKKRSGKVGSHAI